MMKRITVQINPSETQFDRIANLNIREGSDDAFKKLKELRAGSM